MVGYDKNCKFNFLFLDYKKTKTQFFFSIKKKNDLMENLNNSRDDRGIPNLSSSRFSYDQEELFISIYRKEKVGNLYSEMIANTLCMEIFGLLIVGFLIGNLKYYFFIGFWILYDWGSLIYLIYFLSKETRYKIQRTSVLKLIFLVLECEPEPKPIFLRRYCFCHTRLF